MHSFVNIHNLRWLKIEYAIFFCTVESLIKLIVKRKVFNFLYLVLSLVAHQGCFPFVSIKIPDSDGIPCAMWWLYFMRVPFIRPEKYNSIEFRFNIGYRWSMLRKYPIQMRNICFYSLPCMLTVLIVFTWALLHFLANPSANLSSIWLLLRDHLDLDCLRAKCNGNQSVDSKRP